MLDREPICTEPIKNPWEAQNRGCKDMPVSTGLPRTLRATPVG